ncbi:MAG: cation-efflux pump, partial [Clostridia bacterium]|nr:cation-efflux pump [Clostridia bacterium]
MTPLLIKLFIKNPDDIKNTTVRAKYGNLGSFVGILCNLLLCVFKITIGSITGSISITADGL